MYTVQANFTTQDSNYKNYLGLGVGFGFLIAFVLIFFILG